MMTNPIWVVKVRMFTTRADSPTAYRSLWGNVYAFLTAFVVVAHGLVIQMAFRQ